MATISNDVINRVSTALRSHVGPKDLKISVEFRILEADGSVSSSSLTLANGGLSWSPGPSPSPDLVISMSAGDAAELKAAKTGALGESLVASNRIQVRDPSGMIGLATQYAFTPLGEAYRQAVASTQGV
jgi:hypothetical protein